MNDQVKEGYNKAAENYSEGRDKFKSLPHLEELNKLLPQSSTVLDIGCGAGDPVDKYLVEHGHKVIGLDISEKQIELARVKVPGGQFSVKDMSELTEGDYQDLDAVVSFYAIFHTPKETHLETLQKINSFLKNNGLLLVTMGSGEWEGSEENFFGAKMFWSHFGAEKNIEIIKEAGFEIISDHIDTTGGENHLVVLARKV